MKESQSPLKDASLKQESNKDEPAHNNNAYPETFAAVGKSLLDDPILSDVELEATDGVKLSAHRNILASRSPVFKQLLAGDFSEAKSPVVSLGFESNVLKGVLEFCYTDEINFPNYEIGSNTERSIVHVAMRVFSAADYFALPKLCTKVVDWATAQMEKNPSLAIPFLIEAEASSQADIWAGRCHEVMAAHPEACLSIGEDTLGRLNLKTIERIVSDENMIVKESALFSLVASWAGAADSKKRKADAIDLVARHILLDHMAVSELVAIVEPSDLVTSGQICDAYKSIATRAGASSILRGVGGRWETTRSNIFQSTTTNYGTTELLECQPMRTGKHQWSIEVTSCCDLAFLGLASSSGEINRTLGLWHSKQQHGWAWRNDGWTHHAGSNGKHGRLSGFKQGDTMTFTLDLSGPVISLKACVNNGEEHTIFDHDELTSNGTKIYSFVPAVSLRAPGAVRFCGFVPT